MKIKSGKKKIVLISVLTPVAALLLAFLILCLVTVSMFSPTFLGRVLTHWDSSVTDYKVFPERVIRRSGQPYSYAKNIDLSLGSVKVNHKNKQKNLTEFVKGTGTTSFIIVKNDEIV